MAMNQRTMRHKTLPKTQQGVALLVALIMTLLFVLIGITVVEKTKTTTELAGSNTRYQVVFEAAETTLRNAMQFMQNIRNGEPIASENGAAGKSIAANFELSQIGDIGYELVANPAYSFVWLPDALEKQVCPANSDANTSTCPAGVDFVGRIDDKFWNDYAIPSTLSNPSNIDTDNYLLNTKTYTFIQLMKSGNTTDSLGIDGNLSNNQNNENFYLITVKASGYHPNTTPNAENARENVIIQAVYASKY